MSFFQKCIKSVSPSPEKTTVFSTSPARGEVNHGIKSLLILVFYALIASLYYGIGVLNHLNTHYVGYQADPALFIWMLNWWPFALSHHLNPLYTHYLWQPVGYSIANATSIPFLSLFMWPVTKLWGAFTSYNLLAIYLNALSAWTAYLLCRYLGRSTLAAIIGGFIFGFSTYQIGQTLGGHLNLLSTFVLPLLILTAIKLVRGELKIGWAILWMTLCFSIQFGLSREILVSSLLIGLIAGLWSYWFYRKNRPMLRKLVKCVVISLILSALITSPDWLVYFHYRHLIHYHDMVFSFAQPLNLIVPTPITWMNIPWLISHYTLEFYNTWSYKIENGAYIGAILLVWFFIWSIRHWRQPTAKVLCLTFLSATILSFGIVLAVCWTLLPIPLPGLILHFTPGLKYLLAVRFMLYAWLCLAIASTYWIAQLRRYHYKQWLLLVLGLIMIVPTFNWANRPWQNALNTPSWIKNKNYQHWIKPDQSVLFLTPLPANSHDMLWQIQSQMYYKMATGYVGSYPENYPYLAFAKSSVTRHFSWAAQAQFTQLVQQKFVPLIISNAATRMAYPLLFKPLKGMGTLRQHVWLYHL